MNDVAEPRSVVGAWVPLSVVDAVGALTSASAARRWLGADPRGDRVHPGLEVALPGGAGGRVTGVCAAHLDLAVVDAGGDGWDVRVTFEGIGARRTGLRVEPPSAAAILDDALREAQLIGFDVADRRTPRQAVVLIHGIGEQTPGSTIRDFVEGVLHGEGYLSKPDRFSPTLELRRLQAWADERVGRPRTDFYEYYWAHLLRDTSRSQVVTWLWALARRPRGETPRQLHTLWWLTRLLPAVAILLAGSLVWIYGLGRVSGFWEGVVGFAPFALLFTVVSGAIGGFLTSSLGDAARYLTPKPGNVEVRRAIREGGIDLLRRLEGSGRYHRIVVVGHSLGSVIAYDVLTHHFCTRNLDVDPQRAGPGQPALQRYESAEPGVHQDLQHELWKELRRAGSPWLVTDLVTLGSPLTHAVLLMAQDRQDLRRRQDTREYPTSPPVPDRDAAGVVSEHPFSFSDPTGARYLHHAAVFGPTRWTNLYFPARAGLFGDPVGGPLAGVFGPGVLDIPVTRSRRAHDPRSHSSYWLPDPGGEEAPGSARPTLERALALDSAGELAELAQDLPVTWFVPPRSREAF